MRERPADVYLSVVIPAYNEADRIAPTLERVMGYLDAQAWPSELLVVVDGSRDGTADVVRRVAGERVLILDNPVNRGKGYCVRRGMLKSRGRYALFCDADLSTPIEEVERLIAAIDAGAAVAIGSRGLPTSDVRVRQPWWRESMGRAFNWFVQRLALPGVWDSQCGFKCFPQSSVQAIFPRQRIDRFAFDVEVLWIARRLGLPIAEVPVTWRNHPESKVNPVRDAGLMFLDLVRIRVNQWRGVYGL